MHTAHTSYSLAWKKTFETKTKLCWIRKKQNRREKSAKTELDEKNYYFKKKQ